MRCPHRTTRVASSPVDVDRARDHEIHTAVHKTRKSACLVQDWSPAGQDQFTVRLRPSKAVDSYYRPQADTAGYVHDVMTLGEAVRQVGLLLPHVAYGVPADWSFIMTGLDADIGGPASAPHADTAVEVLTSCRPLRAASGALRSMVLDLDFLEHDRVFARGQGRLTVVSPQLYRRLRPSAGPASSYVSPLPRLACAAVGRDDPADVVLGRDPSGGLRIAVDTGHPVLFDHPGDHLPGMVALEAARQAHVLATGRQPRSFNAEFSYYIELQPDAEVAIGVTGPTVGVDIRQDGRTAIHLTMTSP